MRDELIWNNTAMRKTGPLTVAPWSVRRNNDDELSLVAATVRQVYQTL